ncbi:MAG: CBS domain-containing protein [Gammaproteobacteria bacterium]|nr:CBS domain-containing protein [Gammaproteobacteria bacterium]MBT8135361.1 CBS domain-containing protein [Gammaproteobacteria bacterium]NNJ50993.1 CBS domain-containing protein [Gammaproteobacteria bacterium]
MTAEDKKMITIEEFMTPDPYTLRQSDSINDAWEVMIGKHVRHIPVTDDNNHVVGLVTQRDVLAATDPGAIREAKSASHEVKSDVTLSEIMIRDVTVIRKDDSLRQAALYLQTHKYGCLPVVVDDRLVGIITDSDFIDIAINLIEQVEVSEEESLMDYEAEQDIDDIDLPETDEMI